MKVKSLPFYMTLALLLQAASAAASQNSPAYFDAAEFKQLAALVPEITHPSLPSLSAAGQALWEKGQMRIPEDAMYVLHGDFNADGDPDVAVLLRSEDQLDNDIYFLVASRHGGKWKKMRFTGTNEALWHLDSVQAYKANPKRWTTGNLMKHHAAGLVFDRKRLIVGVLTGEKERVTKAASRNAGSVVEKQLILPVQWDKRSKSFRGIEPVWYIDAESEATLRMNGVNVEAQREWWDVKPKGR